MRTLNLRDVVELVEKAIEGREDYDYTRETVYLETGSCVNVLYDVEDWESGVGTDPNAKEGKTNFRPGCVVGTALIKGGIVDQDWFFDDEHRNDSSIRGVASTLFDSLDVHFTRAALNFLGKVQAAQDSGNKWGYAYQRAWDLTLESAFRYVLDSFNNDEEEYVQSLFGQFRPKEENAVSS